MGKWREFSRLGYRTAITNSRITELEKPTQHEKAENIDYG